MSAVLLLVVAFGVAAVAIAVMLLVDPSSPRRRARQTVDPPPTAARAAEVVRADYRRLFRRGRVATRAFWQMRVAPRWHDGQEWCRALAGQLAARARRAAASEASRSGEQSPAPRRVESPRPSTQDEQRVA